MAPKMDVNRSGAEQTDFPSICENCLPPDNYIQMLKQDFGAECKLCSRPFTVFRFKADRTSRQKQTNICMTCARLKNCCQTCMLDLAYGLPIQIRDAALKMIAPGPQSAVNKEYYAQQHERAIEEGRGAVEVYEKTDEKARELLRRLANSEPYYKKQRRMDLEEEDRASGGGAGQKALPAASTTGTKQSGYGPVRARDSRYGTAAGLRGAAGAGRGGARGVRPGRGLPIRPEDVDPPADPNITSLFVTGVEDDQPEHEIRTFFAQYGTIRSLVCSHRSHCAFINYATREGAETAAKACQGKAVVRGVPLRVSWGRPKTLDTMDRDVRMQNARAGREIEGGVQARPERRAIAAGKGGQAGEGGEDFDSLGAIAPPPGADDEVNYASLAGN